MSQPSPEATADGERSSCFRRFRYDNDRSWFKYFRFREDRDPDDARHVLLVVVTLIAGVTFQAGVNPPGGVWQDSNGHTAGQAIYGSHKIAFYVFLVSNTLALSTSIFVILSLTYRFPFRLEVWMATVSMLTTYGSAIVAVTPHELVKFRYILLAALAPGVLRALVQVYRAR